MKSFLCALCIAALVIAGSIAYTRHIDKLSQELLEENRTVTALVERDDFGGAGEALAGLCDYVQEKKTALAAMGNHEEIDKIEIYLAELEQYINGGMKTDALARCGVLEKLFEYMPKNYRLRAENIL